MTLEFVSASANHSSKTKPSASLNLFATTSPCFSIVILKYDTQLVLLSIYHYMSKHLIYSRVIEK